MSTGQGTTRIRGSTGESNRVAVVMLFLASLILASGWSFLREWSALTRQLAFVAAIWTLAGIVAAACAMRLLFSSIKGSWPLWIGAASSTVAGVTLAAGVLTHAIPCPGPTCVKSRLITAFGLLFFGVVAPRVGRQRSSSSIETRA